MVLKPVGTQNTPKKQYNMDTRIAKNPSEIPQSHNDFGEVHTITRNQYLCGLQANLLSDCQQN